MAKILVRGTEHTIELSAAQNGGVDAICLGWDTGSGYHLFDCEWSEGYATWNDAVEYSQTHADTLKAR